MVFILCFNSRFQCSQTVQLPMHFSLFFLICYALILWPFFYYFLFFFGKNPVWVNSLPINLFTLINLLSLINAHFLSHLRLSSLTLYFSFSFHPPLPLSDPADLIVVPGGDRQNKRDTERGQRETEGSTNPWGWRWLQTPWPFSKKRHAELGWSTRPPLPEPTSRMSRRSSTGDLVPRDISEILAREARAQRGQKKTGSSLGQAFSWLKGSRRKKSISNGLSRTGIGVTDVKLGFQSHDPDKGELAKTLHFRCLPAPAALQSDVQ